VGGFLRYWILISLLAYSLLALSSHAMSGHTFTASTQPFTDSAEVQRRVAGGTPPNQPSYDASTQPFTDSAEARRRAGVAAPEPVPQPLQPTADEPLPPAPMPHHHIHDTSPPEPPLPHPPPPLPPPAPTPLDFPIEGLAEAFANASLATLPDARLVLASPAGSSPDGSDSVIIPLPGGIGGWDTVGIVQRTRDVDFVIDLPFWIQSKTKPFQWTREQLQCRLYYDPASDDCLLVNESLGHMYLTRLVPAGDDQPCLSRFDRYVVSPGVWRISIFEHAESRQHLLDFCLLRRQFLVDISEAPATIPSSSKHPGSSNDEVAIKRRRLQGDLSEILLSPAAIRPPHHHPSDADAIAAPNNTNTAALSLGINTPTPTRQISQPGVPLLDLRDGEVAIVKTTQAKDTETQATHVTAWTWYRLRRVGGVANTAASSVFAGQHSELSEPIVAKVIRYKGMSSSDLVKCAGKWRRERDFLDGLRHVSLSLLIITVPTSTSQGSLTPNREVSSLSEHLTAAFSPSTLSVCPRHFTEAQTRHFSPPTPSPFCAICRRLLHTSRRNTSFTTISSQRTSLSRAGAALSSSTLRWQRQPAILPMEGRPGIFLPSLSTALIIAVL